MTRTARDAAQDAARVLERTLDDLADQARTAANLTQFSQTAIKALAGLTGARQARFWLQEGTALELVAQLGQMQQLPAPTLDAHGDHETGPLPEPGWVMLDSPPGLLLSQRLPAVSGISGQIEATYSAGLSNAEQQHAGHIVQVIGQITTDCFQRLRLLQLRARSEQTRHWLQLATRLGTFSDATAVARCLTTEARTLVDADRLSVLVSQGGSWRLLAATGLDGLQHRSPTIASLREVAATAAAHPPLWECPPTTTSTSTTSPIPAAAWQLHQSLTGANRLVAAAYQAPLSQQRTVPVVVVIAEWFPPLEQPPTESAASDSAETARTATDMAIPSSSPPAGRTSASTAMLPLLADLAGPLVWQHWRWEQIPLRRVWTSAAQASSLRRTLLLLVLGAACIAALCLIEQPLIVGGTARLWPQQRQHVFTPAPAVVDTIHIQHDQLVEPGELLLTLRSDALQTEQAQLSGELATVLKRLDNLRATRLDDASRSAADPSRQQQLAGEEEELRVRETNLQQLLKLVDQQQQALQIRSPLGGRVLTWDLERRLLARPVQPGQILVTIGETEGPWIAEIDIADRDAALVRRAMHNSRGCQIELVPAARPELRLVAQPRQVRTTVEIDPQGVPSVRVIADFSARDWPELKPGASVTPRLDCGLAPVGYVWFRDLIDRLRAWWPGGSLGSTGKPSLPAGTSDATAP